MRECDSCAARANETAFPGERGRMCCDCLAYLDKNPSRNPGKPPRSRRSYRQALRHRQQSPQLDLVDLITPVPGGPL